MSSRWYNIAVLGLWLASMGWLVAVKIIIPLLGGDPPNYAAIADSRYDIPIGWRLLTNGQPVGWALSTAERKRGGETEVRSRVHFDHIPLEELTPSWLRGLLGQVVDFHLERQAMDCESTLTIDAEGCLRRLRSAIHCERVRNVVCLRGKIVGTQLRLTVQSGNFSYSSECFVPPKALAGDTLSPQAWLPGLRSGQSWSVPSYSPLRPPNNPLELLKATVEGQEAMPWCGRMEQVWRVVYRSDPGFGLSSDKAPRGRLWVRRDGAVLRQQAMVFDCVLTFVRLSDDEAAELAEQWETPR